ncbi:HesB/IscA family protein [Wigglesworthia glossinidia]|nr:iron-sulfur cluster assembly accessory protein [Wigglesworthia glossinidia]
MKHYKDTQKSLKKFILTESAVKKINQLIKQNPSILGIRISLKRSGCAGWSYLINTVSKFTKDDFVYEYKGVQICTLKKFLPFINTLELDYIKNGLGYKFKFNNPNAKNICGCGKSINF